MPFELQTSAGRTHLILAGRLGVRQARPLWDALQAAIGANETIHVQADQLEEMDTSIVQILCRLSGQTGRLQIAGTSDGFLASLKRGGLEKLFVHPPGSSEEKPQAALPEPATATETHKRNKPHG